MSRTTPRSDGQRPEIQGLRALAVVAVVLFHSGGLLPGGYLGVDLFFVISGYVITASLQREWFRTGRVDVARFAIRRIYRLLPVFFVVVVTTAVAAVLLWPLRLLPEIMGAALAATTLSANIYFASKGAYFDTASELNPLLHMWTLSVEEQFYLLWPWVFVVAGAIATTLLKDRQKGAAAFFWLCILLFGLSVALFGLLGAGVEGLLPVSPAAQGRLAFFSPATRAWEFCGGALALLLQQRRTNSLSEGTQRALSLCGFTTIMVAFALAAESDGSILGWGVPATVIGTAAILFVDSRDTGSGLFAVLSSRPLVWIGDRSYGWYLWHWPPLAAANVFGLLDGPFAALAAAGSLALSAASYRWIELFWRSRGRSAAGASAGRILAVSITTGFVFWGSAHTLVNHPSAFGIAALRQLAESQAPPLSTRLGCILTNNGPSVLKPACEVAATNPKGTLWLVGDSHGGAASDGVVPAAAENGLTTVLLLRAGCPISRVARQGRPECHTHYQWLVNKLLVDDPPSVIVLVHRSTLYVGAPIGDSATMIALPKESNGGASEDGPVPYGEEGAALFFAGVRDFLLLTKRLGVPVVYVRTVPEYEAPPSDCVRIIGSHCREDASREFSDRRRDALHGRETSMLSEFVNVVTVEPFDVYCEAATCVTMVDGKLLYSDKDHVSRAGAALLKASLSEAIAAALKLETGLSPKPTQP